jgi:hypothetical protein
LKSTYFQQIDTPTIRDAQRESTDARTVDGARQEGTADVPDVLRTLDYIVTGFQLDSVGEDIDDAPADASVPQLAFTAIARMLRVAYLVPVYSLSGLVDGRVDIIPAAAPAATFAAAKLKLPCPPCYASSDMKVTVVNEKNARIVYAAVVGYQNGSHRPHPRMDSGSANNDGRYIQQKLQEDGEAEAATVCPSKGRSVPCLGVTVLYVLSDGTVSLMTL